WRGAVLINWLQDLFPEVAAALGPKVMSGWLYRGFMSARDHSLRLASMNVVLSSGMHQRLLARGVDDAHVKIISNWADTLAIRPMLANNSATRRRLGLERSFVVGYSGNLGRAHEFDTLLGAARLLRSDPEIAFLITGGGAKANALRQAVEAESLTNF